ncbi:prolyl oligopeptidase family serine peptidase [Companilactobacillus ginsenosidimutans]|uniref:prolyl oligopeptidase family serine peptidase n=1 Tax=Companilactobacillus ginsenosidimutans TaxID=1007676 RepID=UPI00065F6FF9|nr:prolyl oligopeptidase family serine peptidase [Companilactobacillus ginsenosidimutans]
MRFKKVFLVLVAFIASICGLQFMGNYESVHADSVNSNYQMVAHGYDWGPAIDQVVINTSTPINSQKLSTDTFNVSNSDTYIPSTKRTVTKAYVSDAKGNPVDFASSRFITLNLQVDPDLTVSNPFYFHQDSQLNIPVSVQFQITQNSPLFTSSGAEITKIAPTPRTTDVSYPELDKFSKNYSFTYQDKHFGTTKMQYTYYQAPTDQKHALIIWLHGAGEGGWQPKPVSLLGSKAVTLAQNKIQSYFGNGADILVPQARTYWLDTRTANEAGADDFGALGSNSTTLGYPNTVDGNQQRSRYESGLTELIKEYIKSHPNIDQNKIYIGGCSNGGYMALRMMIIHPDKFSAAFPTCEAYLDKNISNKQISTIKNENIWFTQSRNDPIVNPQTSTVPTYKRLMAAGSKNVHFTFMDDVHDRTGLYKGKDGLPYQYLGHFSWIDVLDDYPAPDYDGSQSENPDGTPTTVLSWVSQQTKKTNWK